MEFQTVRVSGSPQIAVDHAGNGDLVVFLHGIGGNRRNWRDVLLALSDRYHTVAWDGRGWGDSEDYDGPLRFEDMAADLARVLDHFGAAKAHIVGLSLGVKVALFFAHLYPERLLSLTLCDGSITSRSANPETLREFVRLRQQPLLEGKEPADIAGPVARSLVSPRAVPGALEQLIDSMSRLHKDMYLKALELAVMTPDAPGLDRISVPTLVVVGEDDTLTPVAAAEQIANAIKGARLIVVPHAGHLVNIEQPHEFNRILREFLDEVSLDLKSQN
jgi:3-oxoadipate enol-lactonase